MIKVTFIIFFFYIIQFINSQSTFHLNEKSLALQILSDCYGYTFPDPTTADPCGVLNAIFCKVGANPDGTTFIFDVRLLENNYSCTIGDLSNFPNLKSLSVYGNHSLGTAFFQNINNLTVLNDVTTNIQSETIPINVKLPSTLITFIINNLLTALPIGFFESNIQNLYIYNAGFSASYPSSLKTVNKQLTEMVLSVNQNSIPPFNMGSYLSNLNELILNVINEKSIIGYTDYSFPTFQSFRIFKHLTVNFQNNQNENSIQLFNFPSTFNNIQSLSKLNINGIGFTVDSSLGYIDLRNNPQTFDLIINGTCELFSSCTTTNDCVRLPKTSSLTVLECSFNISNINYLNITSFKSTSNNLSQTLPEINNPLEINSFIISNTAITGIIPQSYCKIGKSIFQAQNNKLNGVVPSCYQCQGGSLSSGILPNNFDNFNSSTPKSCPAFSVDDSYNRTIDTIGGLLIVNGIDLGWSITSTMTIGHRYSIPNYQIGFQIPSGIGKNNQFSVSFTSDNTHTFYYDYIPPTIASYSIIEISGSKYFAIDGNGFDTNNANVVLFNNGQSINFSTASNGRIVCTSIDLLSQLVQGMKYHLSMKVGGQDSNVFTFGYYNITVSNSSSLSFNTDGGLISIDGSFGTTNSSLVYVEINGIKCTVESITYEKLTISYPSSISGNFILSINIEGGQLSIPIKISDANTSGSVTSSSSTTTSTSSSTTTTTSTNSPTTSTNSGNEPNPSSSSILSISFYLLTLVSFISINSC
ncbi:hypothetical protein DDB_G0281377 [Dictyostelium discoideum AX4]|uniref:Cell surface glycoprotein n=1 Tax=Dictyostelium discoideum TaxID=44689 RepID=Q54U18_DICDI|nr:hypothetical protein DDB_G0281377 [Dictyostelium discoideum AX4]EAL66774.1 hypothetical protein DDB_G0281377 [Dictyostelium discoideum AX4]|eukprot:XP_640747.1 hypothetical protein DDB_G0281377 [Dictyostelium discoideum AX4]